MMISIHALRGGSDPEAVGRNVLRQPISIHAPRGGSDVCRFRLELYVCHFNPRSPWGERPFLTPFPSFRLCYFNPRSPWGERHKPVFYEKMADIFQSTLPVGGATRGSTTIWPRRVAFQSTLPVGGATLLRLCPAGGAGDFNPRSPWGERRNDNTMACETIEISIHAPRGGSDVSVRFQPLRRLNFNPRSPWGERLFHDVSPILDIGISIHAPRGGSDLPQRLGRTAHLVFQSTLPVGGATM